MSRSWLPTQAARCLVAAVLLVVLNMTSTSPSSAEPGFVPPGSAQAAGARHIVLIYDGASHKDWPVEDLVPYVAHVDQNGVPRDLFFDTFLILPLTAKSGTCFYPGFAPHPSTLADWHWYIDQKLFGGDKHILNLERAVQDVQTSLGLRALTRKVILTVPFPDPKQHSFGDIDGNGRIADLSRESDRLSAVEHYTSTVLQRWSEARLQHLELIGFYWLEEQVKPEDRKLLPKVAAMLHERGRKFFQIPYNGAAGAGEWKELGFDAAMFQPNYFFRDCPPETVDHAIEFARKRAMGIEIEFDGKLLTPVPDHRAKYKYYLDAALRHGAMPGSLCGWYEGGGALLQLARSSSSRDRGMYDCTWRFVMGTYKPEDFPLTD